MTADSLMVHISCGYACNNNCIYCLNLDTIEKLRQESAPLNRTAGEIKGHVLDAKKKGAQSIVFTGGEASIRKDFFELLEFAVKEGLSVYLQTNGRAFSVPSFAEKTHEIAPEMRFLVAMNHTSPKIHDTITMVKGAWAQTVEGIKNLAALYGSNVSANVVVTSMNFKNMPAMVGFLAKLGVRDVNASYTMATGNVLRYGLMPGYGSMEPYIKKSLDTANKLGLSLTYSIVPFCVMRGYEKHSQELAFSMQNVKKEIRRASGGAVDFREGMLAHKCKPLSCKPCRYFNVCEGVWTEYLQVCGAAGLKPVKGKRIETAGDLEKLLKASR